VKLCHIYCSGPVFFATQCIIAIDVQSYTFHCCRWRLEHKDFQKCTFFTRLLSFCRYYY